VSEKREYKGGFSTGGFYLSIPRNMSQEDYDDFKDLLAIVFRQIERGIKAEEKHLYQDKDGVIHSCEKGNGPPGIVLVWTKCNKDVPENKSFVSNEKPTCEQCLKEQEVE